jgi:hypothetical protein
MFVFFKGEGDDFGLVQSKPAVEFSVSKKLSTVKKRKAPTRSQDLCSLVPPPVLPGSGSWV